MTAAWETRARDALDGYSNRVLFDAITEGRVVIHASPLPGEYVGRARYREELAEECSVRGLYQEARRHWDVADLYRALAAGEAPE